MKKSKSTLTYVKHEEKDGEGIGYGQRIKLFGLFENFDIAFSLQYVLDLASCNLAKSCSAIRTNLLRFIQIFGTVVALSHQK
jgi:hypothetical protein